MTNHPDVLDEIEDLMTVYAAEVSFAYGGGGYGEVGDIVDEHIRKIKAKILSHFRSVEEIEAAMPKKAEVGFEFFIEDKSQGWTKEQLQERVWGYNQALDDVRKALGLEGRDE